MFLSEKSFCVFIPVDMRLEHVFSSKKIYTGQKSTLGAIICLLIIGGIFVELCATVDVRVADFSPLKVSTQLLVVSLSLRWPRRVFACGARHYNIPSAAALTINGTIY